MRSEVKEAIVQRLSPLVQEGLSIEDSPKLQNPRPRARLQVFIEGTQSDSPTTMRPVLQERTIKIRLNLILIDLRTEDPAYPYLDRIEELLTGFQPLCRGEIYLVSDEYQQTEDGIWFYTMQVAFKHPHTQRRKT